MIATMNMTVEYIIDRQKFSSQVRRHHHQSPLRVSHTTGRGMRGRHRLFRTWSGSDLGQGECSSHHFPLTM
jgi:hypothetical protein